MADRSGELMLELKTLRKGRALYGPNLSERVGPALRELCGVLDGDRPIDARRKITERLERLGRELPEDLRVSVMAALAVHPDARQPFYQDRIRWVAGHLRRDERTARRRVDEATSQLAEIAATWLDGDSPAPGPDPHPGDWHIEELRTWLVLDQPSPEAIEYRRVVADTDGVAELDLAITLPRYPAEPAQTGDLVVDVLHGGTLSRRFKESTERFGFVLTLPQPLRHDEKHEYALRFRVPPGQRMRPHYVALSKRRCDSFDLRVRFDPARLPERIWQISEAFQRDVDDPQPIGDPISADGAGEIHLQFRGLAAGLAYGVRWSDP